MQKPTAELSLDTLSDYLAWIKTEYDLTYDDMVEGVDVGRGSLKQAIHDRALPRDGYVLGKLFAFVESYLKSMAENPVLAEPCHLVGKGHHLMRERQYQEALACYDKAMLEIRTPRLYHDTLVQMARAHISLNQYDRAVEVLNEISDAYPDIRLSKTVTWGGLYFIQGDWDRARPMLEEAEILARNWSIRELLNIRGRLIGIHLYEGRLDRAEEYAWLAAEDARYLDDYRWLAKLFMTYADIYHEQGDAENVKRCLDRGLELASGVDAFMALAHLYRRLARWHREQHDPRTAYGYAHVACEIAEIHQFSDALVAAYAEFAEALADLGQTGRAERWGRHACTLGDNHGSLHVPEAYIARSRTAPTDDEALQLLDWAERFATERHQYLKLPEIRRRRRST